MKFEIKHKYTGTILFAIEANSLKLAVQIAVGKNADLRSADLRYADLSYADLRYADLRSADLSYADLRYADLSYADLRYADLRYADLRYADLRSADLRYANLRYADLRSADLRYADLRYAKGINKYQCTPLLILKEQVGKIRAYKLTNGDYEGPFNGGIKYKIGKVVSAKADTNERIQCSHGISLATLSWCMKEWCKGYHILVCEFTQKDLAVVPTATDGKFRVHRCKVIKEVDLEKIGLVKKESEKPSE